MLAPASGSLSRPPISFRHMREGDMLTSETIGRQFEFDPTVAVVRSRSSGQFIPCPACASDAERYLFHRRGARFVQCRTCSVVYVNPPAQEVRDYFDVETADRRATVEDHSHLRKELDDVLGYARDTYRSRRGAEPRRIVVTGRLPDEDLGPDVSAARLTHEQTLRLVRDADVEPILEAIPADVELLVLNQLLEACPRASEVLAALAARLPVGAQLVVVYSNVASLPGRMLRRHWGRFFNWKAVYFDSENLRGMVERAGLRFVAQSGLNTSYTVSRALDLVAPNAPFAGAARRLGLGNTTARVPTGNYVSVFERPAAAETGERLSVVVPVFNEKDYVAQVLEELLRKQFAIPHEVIVVESNSTDGTREIVRGFEGRPG